MLQVEPSFRRVVERDGYPRLEDLGLIGDGTTAALVGLDGTVWWLCVPRFDAEPLVCGLLDRQRGGRFVVAPAAVVEARHWYEADTAVLVTELRTPTGLMRLTDALVVRAGADLSDDSSAARREFVRSVLVLDGNVELRAVLEPKGGATARVGHGGLDIEAGAAASIPLHLRASRPVDGLSTEWTLSAGEQVDVVLSWGGSSRHHRFSCGEMLAATADAW